MAALHRVVGDDVERRHLLVPLGALPGSLADGLVVDAPADEILSAVSLESELVGTFVTHCLLELLITQAGGEICCCGSCARRETVATTTHYVDCRIGVCCWSLVPLVEGLSIEQEHIGVAQEIPVHIGIVGVLELFLYIFCQIPFRRRKSVVERLSPIRFGIVGDGELKSEVLRCG